jgi:toxin ParE1/3/4
MKIIWSPLARARLRELRAYVALDKPDAAQRLVTRIVAMVEVLRHHPHAGRVGIEPDIRELVVGGTPYIILYRVRDEQVLIRTIWHGAQHRPD